MILKPCACAVPSPSADFNTLITHNQIFERNHRLTLAKMTASADPRSGMRTPKGGSEQPKYV